MKRTVIVLDVTDIIEGYLYKHSIFQNKMIIPEQYFNMLLEIPLSMTDIENYVYETIENIFAYPNQYDDTEQMLKFNYEAVSLSNYAPAVIVELEKRAYAAYAAYVGDSIDLTTGIKLSQQIYNEGKSLKFHDITTNGTNTFLFIDVYEENFNV